jgi:hypothetical protein
LKEERTGRRDFEKAFWEFTKSLDPSKFTVRQYVTYRQAAKASTSESSAAASSSAQKISPSPAAVEAMKRSLDNWSMRIGHFGYSMPDRRQDARRNILGDTFSPSYEGQTELQKQKNRDEYLLELDRLDEADAAQYKRFEPDLRSVLSDAFTMLDFPDSRKVSELAKFNDLSERATSSTHRSENASPHEKDYNAIASYLHSIAVQL